MQVDPNVDMNNVFEDVSDDNGSMPPLENELSPVIQAQPDDDSVARRIENMRQEAAAEEEAEEVAAPAEVEANIRDKVTKPLFISLLIII